MEIPGLNEALQRQQAPLIEAVQSLVRIPSVIDEKPEPGGPPFGAEIDRALRQALEIAAGLGFRTFYAPGGYYGYAETGAGAEMAAVLGHVDVVPAGRLLENGQPDGSRADWLSDPFDPQVRDGKLYGRGVQDDKGPTLAALFGARALMDAGVTFNKRLRFIFGADEENLWRCMKAYLAQEELPALGFTPDAKFPLIYAEKGLLQCVLEGENTSGLRLSAGGAFNAVPDTAEYRGQGWETVAQALADLGYAHERLPDGVRVTGKAAHAQVTEEGINAVCRLALALQKAGLRSKAIDFLAQEIGEDPYATRIFGPVEDADTGKLKVNAARIVLDGGESLALDLRIPVSMTKEAIVYRLAQAAARYGLGYRQHDWQGPLHIPRDHFLVQTLMQVYREVTGDLDSQPEASGGATYARAMPNCVAFGAVFPGRRKVEHQPNEHIALQDLYTAMEIYARAIAELTR